MYSYVEDGENVTVGYSVAITGIPGSAASTAIKAVGFAGEGEAISTATEVTRTVKQVANHAGYSFNEETGAMAYSPFAEAEMTGATQFQEIGKVTYTVGDTCPTGFDVAFTATEGAGVNLTITADTAVGKECDFGFGGSRQKSCSLNQGNWHGENAIGTELTKGTVITFTANAADANKVVDFAFTSIKPTGGAFDDVDLTDVSAYKFAGTTGDYQPILTTGAIASDLTGKTLADYSKVVIECDETSNVPLNYSIIAGDDTTDAFIVYEKVAGTIEISLTDNFNKPGDYQKKYDNLAAAQALHASDVRLKVTAPKAGYKGKIIIKSVRFEK